MRFKVVSHDSLSNDGWTERPVRRSLVQVRPPLAPVMRPGDTVLYRADNGERVPAVLVESAGRGCWLARDARHTRGLVYLEASRITGRLPRTDLLEAA